MRTKEQQMVLIVSRGADEDEAYYPGPSRRWTRSIAARRARQMASPYPPAYDALWPDLVCLDPDCVIERPTWRRFAPSLPTTAMPPGLKDGASSLKTEKKKGHTKRGK